MKKMNKKGFTIVELVIVIAVIAILAGVMIPTFSGIVEKANDSKHLQMARNIMTEYIAKFDHVNSTIPSTYYIEVDVDDTSVCYYKVENGKINTTKEANTPSGTVVYDNNGTVTTKTLP